MCKKCLELWSPQPLDEVDLGKYPNPKPDLKEAILRTCAGMAVEVSRYILTNDGELYDMSAHPYRKVRKSEDMKPVPPLKVQREISGVRAYA